MKTSTSSLQVNSPSLIPDFRLSRQEIHLWSVTLDQLPFDEEFRKTLTFDDFHHAQRIPTEDERRDFIARRGLLRFILSCYLPLHPRGVLFKDEENSKLRLAEGTDNGLRFHMSHAAGEVRCAITRDREVGVDLKLIRPVEDADIATAREFTDPERARIRLLQGKERMLTFFRLLTRKAALSKAQSGNPGSEEGINSDMSHDTATSNPLLNGRRSVGNWTVEDLEISSGYASAVAASGDQWLTRMICIRVQ